MVSFQKSFCNHVIQNNRHCRGESWCCQSCVLVSANSLAVRDLYILAYKTALWSSGFEKTHSPFSPPSLIFVLCLPVCIFEWGQAPSVITFLSHVLPCQLILSHSSNVMLPKCRTLSHSFSCSSVVVLHSESLSSCQCGNSGMFWCDHFRQQKGAGFREHTPCSYLPPSSARSWRGLEAVIYILLPISDSHTKCAYVPAVHPHPWAPGSCTALHQGASVSFTVMLVTGVITQKEGAEELVLM